jgi:hypothetical protein
MLFAELDKSVQTFILLTRERPWIAKPYFCRSFERGPQQLDGGFSARHAPGRGIQSKDRFQQRLWLVRAPDSSVKVLLQQSYDVVAQPRLWSRSGPERTQQLEGLVSGRNHLTAPSLAPDLEPGFAHSLKAVQQR